MTFLCQLTHFHEVSNTSAGNGNGITSVQTKQPTSEVICLGLVGVGFCPYGHFHKHHPSVFQNKKAKSCVTSITSITNKA
jgi:hypothetical protein